jgi:hypothetical protein
LPGVNLARDSRVDIGGGVGGFATGELDRGRIVPGAECGPR